MACEYLKDAEFLKALDEMRIKEHYITLQVMNFKEEPIRMIQGIATAGTITVNGSSAVRRTINLTLVAPENENDLSNIDNIISANKKIKVELGLKNPFSNYKYYGDIIWFPLGVFIVTEATSATSATNATISIKGKDKMCMLDGTCGGVFPATVILHETQVELEDGSYTIEKVPIFTIVKECVRHYGQEIEQNIIINDLDIVAKQSVNYIGSQPIWFDEDFKLSPIISDSKPDSPEHWARKYVYGQDIGYIETDFTFPGELVLSAGETVVQALDKIISVIGNYEYFYDLEGRFIFQEKKNYLNHYYTPVTELNDYYYIRAFSDSKYYKIFENAKDSVSYFNAPKFDNLKNDFVVWGTQTSKDGVTKNIKYHLAVDEKPVLDLASQYMWDVTNGNGEHLYYRFGADEEEYLNGPEQTPVEIEFDADTKEEDILKVLNERVHKDYVNYASSESSFVVYFKVLWGNQIRFYKARIKYHQLEYLVYDERLTRDIKDESILIGIYIPPEKEENNLNDEPDDLINLPNPDIPGVGDDSSIDSEMGVGVSITKLTWWPTGGNESSNSIALYNLTKRSDEEVDELVEELDPYFSHFGSSLKDFINGGDKWGSTTYPIYPPKEDDDNLQNGNEEESEEENQENSTLVEDVKNKEFTALVIRCIDKIYALGYTDEKGTWQEVYSLGEKANLNIKDLSSALKSIGEKFVTRVYVFDNFNKENSKNFDSITTINLISQYAANPQKLKIGNNLAEFNYEFNNIKVNDTIKMTSDERKQMITQLLPFYLDNNTELVSDINAVYTVGPDGKISNENNSNVTNGTTGSDNSNPSLDNQFPSHDKSDQTTTTYPIMPIARENEVQTLEELDDYYINALNSLKGCYNISGNNWSNQTPGDNNNSSDSSLDEDDDPTIILPWLDGTEMTFKVINKEQANLIYKYSQAGYSPDNLIEEIYNYWKNNILKKDNINKEYILQIIVSIPEEPQLDYGENFLYTLLGKPCSEWREELYRQALLNRESAGEQGYYDEELIAFWRTNFDTLNEAWHQEWQDYISKDNGDNPWDGWNPAIYRDPGLLVFWLDFLDSDQLVSKYSVNQIGRRTKAITKENVKVLYKLEVPDLLFLENTGDIGGIIQEQIARGQMCCALKKNEMKYFSSSSTGTTAFDLIREMLYNYLSYSTSVTINCIPKYYLEPNNLIYISDTKSNIQGDFFITQFTVPLTYNGTMSINTVQTLIRV